MNNKPNSPESTDSTCMGYGEQVKELLSMNDASVWIDDLWTIYTGFMTGRVGSPRRNWVTIRRPPTFSAHFVIWCFSFNGRSWRNKH
ncbi:MAG: hypothetical protein ABIN80_23335 [Dyadobacter sp.]|uniref:hypothetical protein n=1 Tax=Dyadobacter sp. TaxID=1914288 RepID=UPI00326681D7